MRTIICPEKSRCHRPDWLLLAAAPFRGLRNSARGLVAFFPVAVMSHLLLQFIIVAGFGALGFGCGYLAAFIVTRNQWRDEMIKRGVRYSGRPANGIGGSRQIQS